MKNGVVARSSSRPASLLCFSGIIALAMAAAGCEINLGSQGNNHAAEKDGKSVSVPDSNPKLVSAWNVTIHSPETVLKTYNLWNDGTCITEDHVGTWSEEGNTLTLHWPDAKAPGGEIVETLTYASNKKSFYGKTQSGTAIEGTKQ